MSKIFQKSKSKSGSAIIRSKCQWTRHIFQRNKITKWTQAFITNNCAKDTCGHQQYAKHQNIDALPSYSPSLSKYRTKIKRTKRHTWSRLIKQMIFTRTMCMSRLHKVQKRGRKSIMYSKYHWRNGIFQTNKTPEWKQAYVTTDYCAEPFSVQFCVGS